jgi:hypothetical protein
MATIKKKKQATAKNAENKQAQTKKKNKPVPANNLALLARLEMFVAKKEGDGYSYRQLGIELGLSHSYFFTLARKKGSMGSDALMKLLEHYPDLSAEWLLRGKGSMLVGATSDEDVEHRFALDKLLSKLDTSIAGLRDEMEDLSEINRRMQLTTNRKKRGF